MPIKRISSNPLNQPTPRNWPRMMAHLAYICAGLAAILVFVQLNLYCMRYNRVYNGDAVSAVMLSNGQTYFGHMQKYGPNTVVLFDVYYLQVTDDAATEDTTDVTAETSTDPNSNIKLVRLADDFYQPNNYVVLNRDQIIYWQHLQIDSPILDAISQYDEDSTATE